MTKDEREIVKKLLWEHYGKLAAEMPGLARFLLTFLSPHEIQELYAHHRIMIWMR